MAESFRERIKPISQRLSVDNLLRQGYVNANRLGEMVQHSLFGHPPVSSTIILAGSGRSGTTWLGNIISSADQTQPIFEPLFPLWNSHVRKLTGWDHSDSYFRQIYLKPGQEYPDWTAHLHDVLSGKFRNYWTDYERTCYFPKRYLVKEIRMNLMLGYIYDHFKCKIVYLMRHPCAVVHSRMSLNVPWHADVRDILSQEELVENYLSDWVGEIEREKDLLGAHAVWWAAENMVALHQTSTRTHKRIFYEDAVLHPGKVAHEVLGWLDLTYTEDKIFQVASKHSRMTRPESKRASQLDFLQEWRKKMPEENQKRILKWAHKLGVMDYTLNVVPARMQ